MGQLPGKPYPTDETDQECQYCGLWFSLAGIESHEEHCLVRHSPVLSFDGVKLEARKCPECGGWGGVHLAGCTDGLGDVLPEDSELRKVPVV